MVSPLLQPLSDLCGIRIAYLMWTRRHVTRNCLTEILFDELVDVILNDVEELPLPEKLKYRILKHVRPAGKHLLSLLNLWLPNIRPYGTLHQTYGTLLQNKVPENSQKLLTSDMLFECLILNADGLINQRKTAEKILSSRMLHNVLAFRFACINFLEKEVVKLWILVKEYFLNKIMLEGEQADAFIVQNGKTICGDTYVVLTDQYYSNHIREYPLLSRFNVPLGFLSLCENLTVSRHLPVSQPFPFTTEPDAVLFWIAYCLSKENAIKIEELPHYLGDDIEWYEFSLELAVFSGNAACFDYLRNFGNMKNSYVNIIKKILLSEEEDRKQQCFIFHFLLLNLQEKGELFQDYELEMMTQLLQWPLSLTFVENPERLWNLLPDRQKRVIFREIFYVLFNENILQHSLLYGDHCIFNLDCFTTIPGTYSLEHLSKLFVALWEISPEDNKLFFLDSVLLEMIENWKGQQEFRKNFTTSGLKEKLQQLFLSNVEAVLDLFEGDNLKESLRNLVAKHIPQDFEELDSQCISFLNSQTVQPELVRKEMAKAKERLLILKGRETRCSNIVFPYHEKFLSFIKYCLSSSVN